MAKEYKSISAARKAGSMYYTGKDGKKKLAVTKEQLDAWKEKNKGKYKGSALTAWANAKGKNITGAPASSPRPKLRPGSEKKTGTPSKRLDTKGKTPAGKTYDRVSPNAAARKTDAGVKKIVATAERAIKQAEKDGARVARVKKIMDDLKNERKDDPTTLVDNLQRWIKNWRATKGTSGRSKGDPRKAGMSYGGMAKKRMAKK